MTSEFTYEDRSSHAEAWLLRNLLQGKLARKTGFDPATQGF